MCLVSASSRAMNSPGVMPVIRLVRASASIRAAFASICLASATSSRESGVNFMPVVCLALVSASTRVVFAIISARLSPAYEGGK